jgi:hypothetical protein
MVVEHHLHRVARRHRVAAHRRRASTSAREIMLVEHHLALLGTIGRCSTFTRARFSRPSDDAAVDPGLDARPFLEQEPQRHRRGQAVGVGIVGGEPAPGFRPRDRSSSELGPDREIGERALGTRGLLRLAAAGGR